MATMTTPWRTHASPVGGLAAASTATKKVLLVDDSSTSHMWIKMILKKTDYTMVSAKDGQEGVDKALAEQPDLILMDVVMPRMDGFEATRTLRSLPATRGTPIIMVTTRGEAENLEEGYQSGCTDYITKPIDSVELLAKINNYLDH